LAKPQPAPANDVDDQDADATETALRAALLTMLLDADPTSPAQPGITDAVWRDMVADNSGRMLKDYLRRSAMNMLRATGIPGPRAAELADSVVEQVYSQALETVTEGMERIYHSGREISSGARAYGPGSQGGDPPPDPPSPHDRDTETYRRVRVGSAPLARHQTTSLREAVRYQLAGQLGATHMTWRTRKDDRVRPTHGGMEGDTVPYGSQWETFEGHSLRWPGDPAAPPSETYGCRCRVTYKMPSTRPDIQVGVPNVPPGPAHHLDIEYEGVAA
jgi:hypothetical protein